MFSFTRLLLLVIVIFLLVTFFVFEKNLGFGVRLQTSQTVQPSQTASLSIEGRVLNFSGDVLTLKKTDDSQVKVKVASAASVLKQKRITSYSLGTEPSQVKVDDLVLVTATKNKNGDLETNSVVILLEEKQTTPSSSTPSSR